MPEEVVKKKPGAGFGVILEKDGKILCEPDEIIEWKWIDVHDLANGSFGPLYFPSRLGIENFLQKKFYIKRKPSPS